MFIVNHSSVTKIPQHLKIDVIMIGWPLNHPRAPFSSRKKNIMSSSFALVFSARAKCGFISSWAMNPFTNVELITSQCAPALCFFLLPPTRDISGTSQKDGRSTFPNTQMQWETAVLCPNTPTHPRRRTKPQRRRPTCSRVHTQTHTYGIMHAHGRTCEHTKLRGR